MGRSIAYLSQEMDFWHGVRWKLQQLLDKRAVWDKKVQVETDMEMLKEGLQKLQKLLLVTTMLRDALTLKALGTCWGRPSQRSEVQTS